VVEALLDVAQHRLDPVEPTGPSSLRMKLSWCAALESNQEPTDLRDNNHRQLEAIVAQRIVKSGK